MALSVEVNNVAATLLVSDQYRDGLVFKPFYGSDFSLSASLTITALYIDIPVYVFYEHFYFMLGSAGSWYSMTANLYLAAKEMGSV